MGTYKEKLSMLSEMIAFARVDHSLKRSEYGFLLQVARSLGVSKDIFDGLLKEKSPKVRLKTQAERIVQFHRLILLMNIDQEQHKKEINTLYNIGLKMGLPPTAISQVLEVMHRYPNKIVPPDVLINIFKAHYN
ncbi:TerB family tellurite resistance protein [Flagellimonas halotolerans]|uniref:TerB family tellurite resistance protein n=1 Tax=Flagellimonas halotolerans TaxID=3112164 RepID=A0ABU6IPQ9_9FLAO|nr:MULTISPECIES: TerB family tellurite resistance protein [unclassified Allomuricauda]MEC3965065.1 TerB family tellurite resistance protein [Muricauda sp. SYSU M86414]MEC4265090.1 TerB family tellurite resistance protein [Muricauda sp. SYSU M84420]